MAKQIISDRNSRKACSDDESPDKRQVFVCNGKSCAAVGSAEVKAEFTASSNKKAYAKAKNQKAGIRWAKFC